MKQGMAPESLLPARRSIGARIMILAGGLLALLAGFAGYSLFLTDTTNDSINPIATRYIPLVESISIITTTQFEQHMLMEKALRLGSLDPEEFSYRDEYINNAVARFKELRTVVEAEFVHLDTYLLAYDTQGELSHTLEALSEMRHTYNEFLLDATTLLEQAQTGNIEIANTLVALMELDSEQLGRELLRLLDQATGSTTSNVNAVKTESETFFLSLLMLTLLGLLFGAGFSYELIRRFNHSVRLVTNGISQAALELTDQEAPTLRIPDTGSEDELARIGTNFNQLLDALAAHMERRARAENQLTLALDEANAANRAKSQFLANMSHELRTPLNAILGYSELLIEESDEITMQDATDDLEHILDSGNHLLTLISEILDLSKIEAGSMGMELDNVVLQEVIEGVVGNIRPLVEANGNRFKLVLPDQEVRMQTDGLKLKQIVLNLLSNAAKFTSGGTIDLRIQAFTAQTGLLWIRMVVEDSGIGIPKSSLHTIFDPFQQADNSPTREYGGTGLGLSISKHFTEMLGGRISVHSTVGVGSTFTVEIPTVPDDEASRSPVGSGQSAPTPSRLPS